MQRLQLRVELIEDGNLEAAVVLEQARLVRNLVVGQLYGGTGSCGITDDARRMPDRIPGLVLVKDAIGHARH